MVAHPGVGCDRYCGSPFLGSPPFPTPFFFNCLGLLPPQGFCGINWNGISQL